MPSWIQDSKFLRDHFIGAAKVNRRVSKQKNKPVGTYNGIDRTGKEHYDLADFIGKYGYSFKPRFDLPDDVEPGILGYCFDESYNLTCKDSKRFIYIEGMAATSSINYVHHSWVWDITNKRIADCTWLSDPPMISEDDYPIYIGVPIRKQFLDEFFSDFDFSDNGQRVHGVLINDGLENPYQTIDTVPINELRESNLILKKRW